MKFLVFSLLFGAAFSQTTSSSANSLEAGRSRFNVRCAGCHGQDGLGGERAPAIGHSWRAGSESEAALRDLISKGIPDSGMPAFNVPAAELEQLVAFVRSRVLPLGKTALPGDPHAGEALFFGKARCSECHMVWGRGSVNGPDLTEAANRLTLAEIETALRTPDARRLAGYQAATLQLAKGGEVRGFLRNESGDDVQIQSFDGRLYLLRKSEISRIERQPGSYMPRFAGTTDEARDLVAFLAHAPRAKLVSGSPATAVLPGGLSWEDVAHPKPGDWPTYHGQ